MLRFVAGFLMFVWMLPLHALELEGPRTQGALLKGKVAPGHEVRLNGESVNITDSGRFAVGFGRDADQQQELVVVGPDGGTETHRIELAKRDYDVQRVDGVPDRTVNPDKQAMKRIREEARRVAKARQKTSRREAFLEGFIWPVEGRITGVYGSQRFYNGEPRQPHYGIDIAAEAGRTVLSPASGKVTFADPDLYFSGGTLIIDHGYGVSSTMLHLSDIHVSVGEEVQQGQALGEVGATGRATGAHLDWRMNWRNRRVDPTTIAPGLEDGYTPGASRGDG
ncbi:peptidase M23-like protein [Halospina denitrificans]|uniref:Peptidase M23-like protein n=1 Tax=Halospina denitrificans TaxID=332522 RepID=A0A4V3EPQ1_9GAMM|nr:M23 family metallopeptidase [Halospina denitrificans]TDT38568.1 peptidase M23-like protein [Halospina denitrificans]